MKIGTFNRSCFTGFTRRFVPQEGPTLVPGTFFAWHDEVYLVISVMDDDVTTCFFVAERSQ